MIIEEILKDNTDLIKRYSDQNVYIREIHSGEEYSEAVDLINEKRIEMGFEALVYEETNRTIEQDTSEE